MLQIALTASRGYSIEIEIEIKRSDVSIGRLHFHLLSQMHWNCQYQWCPLTLNGVTSRVAELKCEYRASGWTCCSHPPEVDNWSFPDAYASVRQLNCSHTASAIHWYVTWGRECVEPSSLLVYGGTRKLLGCSWAWWRQPRNIHCQVLPWCCCISVELIQSSKMKSCDPNPPKEFQ